MYVNFYYVAVANNHKRIAERLQFLCEFARIECVFFQFCVEKLQQKLGAIAVSKLAVGIKAICFDVFAYGVFFARKSPLVASHGVAVKRPYHAFHNSYISNRTAV